MNFLGRNFLIILIYNIYNNNILPQYEEVISLFVIYYSVWRINALNEHLVALFNSMNLLPQVPPSPPVGRQPPRPVGPPQGPPRAEEGPPPAALRATRSSSVEERDGRPRPQVKAFVVPEKQKLCAIKAILIAPELRFCLCDDFNSIERCKCTVRALLP